MSMCYNKTIIGRTSQANRSYSRIKRGALKMEDQKMQDLKMQD